MTPVIHKLPRSVLRELSVRQALIHLKVKASVKKVITVQKTLLVWFRQSQAFLQKELVMWSQRSADLAPSKMKRNRSLVNHAKWALIVQINKWFFPFYVDQVSMHRSKDSLSVQTVLLDHTATKLVLYFKSPANPASQDTYAQTRV